MGVRRSLSRRLASGETAMLAENVHSEAVHVSVHEDLEQPGCLKKAKYEMKRMTWENDLK
jgi:hypothetical protein